MNGCLGLATALVAAGGVGTLVSLGWMGLQSHPGALAALAPLVLAWGWVLWRIAGTWREVPVDSEGGYAPKLEFFASGKRVVVYRTPAAVDPNTGLTVANVGALKLAVER